MSALSIQPPYPTFTDIDGQPLENGYIWIGTANQDPQANPIPVYWDKGLTIVAAQPIRTTGGYPANSGTPARIYANGNYSIRVMNKNGSIVYSAAVATEQYSEDVFSSSIASQAEAEAAISNTALMTPLRVKNQIEKLSYAMNEAQGADIASSATINLQTATGNVVDITGTTAITAITLNQGAKRVVRFTGALTLTNSASLVLPTNANITTVAGDYATFRGYAGGVVRCTQYQRYDGSALSISSVGLPQGYLYGLGTSNNTLDTANDIDIAAGRCRDDTNTQDIVLASTLVKRLDAAWAAGTNQGGLDAGSKASGTWYAVYVIKNVTGGAVDVLFSLSATSPVLPSGYTVKRRIGWIRTDGSSNIEQYTQRSDVFLWNTSAIDVSGGVTTTAALYALSVPPSSSTDPIHANIIANGGNISSNYFIRLSSPFQNDEVPVLGNSQLTMVLPSNSGRTAAQLLMLVNSSGQIRARSSVASLGFDVRTQGWVDKRGVI